MADKAMEETPDQAQIRKLQDKISERIKLANELTDKHRRELGRAKDATGKAERERDALQRKYDEMCRKVAEGTLGIGNRRAHDRVFNDD